MVPFQLSAAVAVFLGGFDVWPRFFHFRTDGSDDGKLFVT